MIINGKALSVKVIKDIKNKTAKMTIKPGLAVVLVGDNPASEVYVAAKERACKEVGFYSKKIVLPANISSEQVIAIIEQLNHDPKIHGILVQLPLPRSLDEKRIIETINPEKDVDCLHSVNLGQLLLTRKDCDLQRLLTPCTSKGIIKLIEDTGQSIEGKRAVIVGRSNLVGKPTALLLLAKNATVTICHSKTADLEQETSRADILITAISKPKFITANMVKKGSIVIDVGISRTHNGLVGDVDFAKVKNIAGFITPVPGGVGPMTIACLLENTLLLAQKTIG